MKQPVMPAFVSAFPTDGRPISPAEIIAFHRATFGGARMEDTGGGDGGDGADGGGDQGGDNGGQGGTDKGFPENTPIADMTVEQQAAYWKHQARKHEDTAKARRDYDTIKAERDQLKSSTQTDAEKALEEARTAARNEAAAEARSHFASQLVAAEFKAALAGKRSSDEVKALLEPMDLTKFLTPEGEVDTDKVTNYAAGIAPGGSTDWPGMGQGNRGDNKPAKGVSAGADLYRDSRGKKTN